MVLHGEGHSVRSATTAVVLRFRDHRRFLPAVLAALAAQTLPVRLVGVDTGSRDGSRALVAAAGAIVLELPPERFSYGRAINLGMEATGSEVAVVLSAHAVLEEASVLYRLVAALSDPVVAGAYGRLLPGPDLNPFEARNIRSYYDDVPRLQRDDTRFTNTLSAIRREVWASERFDEEIPGAEDQQWVARIQRIGYAVAYVPSARAVYLQGFGVRRIYKHAVKLGYAHQVMQPDRSLRLLGSLASAAGWTLADLRSWTRSEVRARWLLLSPVFRLRQELGLYVGARRAVRRQDEVKHGERGR